jgi:hypothetical protein
VEFLIRSNILKIRFFRVNPSLQGRPFSGEAQTHPEATKWGRGESGEERGERRKVYETNLWATISSLSHFPT